MTFLLDENFPKAAAGLLLELGHHVIDFRVEGEEGAPDHEVMTLALEREAVVLTTDRDFFHSLSWAFPLHHGILVVALKRPTRQLILERLEWLLSEIKDESFEGRAFQLRDKVWMAFPPLN